MPDESVIATMAAHAVGISRDHYLVTRTREQFTLDAHSIMKSSLLTVEVVSSMFGGESSGESGMQPDRRMADPYDEVRNFVPDDPEHVQKAGPEMSDPQAAAWARREARSHKPYSWYKMSPNKRYNVVNLDTRNPKKFMAGVKKFGG